MEIIKEELNKLYFLEGKIGKEIAKLFNYKSPKTIMS